MLKLSLELPTPYLKLFSSLLDLDFVLAHKVLQDRAYADFFAARERGREVILDNSTHEFGKPMPMAELVKAAKLVHANYLIAPDIVKGELNDPEQIHQNRTWLAETCNVCDSTYDIGAVICGNTFTEFGDYLDDAEWQGVKLICFTFHNENRLKWWKWFDLLDGQMLFPRVHLLGMHTVEELKRWVELSEIWTNISWSFDTSKPLKFGVQGIELDKIENLRGGAVRSKEVLDLEHLTDEQIGYCRYNIEYLKKLCKGEG